MKKSIQKSTFNIRQELILIDFKTYSENARSDSERINSFRQWEVTVLAAIISFALSQGMFRPYLPIVIGILIAFTILEIINRARMFLRHHLAWEIEKNLMTNDDEYILSNYVFTNTLWRLTPRRTIIKMVLKTLVSPQFISWNISLVLIVFALWLTFQ